jgi:hypothetical protein
MRGEELNGLPVTSSSSQLRFPLKEEVEQRPTLGPESSGSSAPLTPTMKRKFDLLMLEKVLEYLPINGKYGERKELWTKIAGEMNESQYLDRKSTFRTVREHFYVQYRNFCERLEVFESSSQESTDPMQLNPMDQLLLKIHKKDKKNFFHHPTRVTADLELRDIAEDELEGQGQRKGTALIDSSSTADNNMTPKLLLETVEYRRMKLSLLEEDLSLKRQFLELLKLELQSNSNNNNNNINNRYRADNPNKITKGSKKQ